MVSVIIPLFNEERILRQQADYFMRLSHAAELIFVDGGSGDLTAEYAQKYGQLLKSKKGRAFQMNLGAQYAHNDILLFLHADAHIEISSLKEIEGFVVQKGYVGGCLSQIYEKLGLIFKWVAFTGNVRAKLSKVFYGDQGIFVQKDIFEQLGGFPQVTICEDILFTKKLRTAGKVDILPILIFCSTRRWKQQGIIKTFLTNMRIKCAVKSGCHPDQLELMYQDVRD